MMLKMWENMGNHQAVSKTFIILLLHFCNKASFNFQKLLLHSAQIYFEQSLWLTILTIFMVIIDFFSQTDCFLKQEVPLHWFHFLLASLYFWWEWTWVYPLFVWPLMRQVEETQQQKVPETRYGYDNSICINKDMKCGENIQCFVLWIKIKWKTQNWIYSQCPLHKWKVYMLN